MLAIAGAQAVTAYCLSPWVILCHPAILFTIIVRSAFVKEYLHRRLLLTLALVPLLGIISLGLPLGDIPPILLHYISYGPVFVAAVVGVFILGYSYDQVGISFRQPLIQLLVGLSGIVFGLIEYFILVSEPLIAESIWQEVWLPALIIFVSVGFVEEFVFRGVIQRSSTEEFGAWGIVYVSLLFTVTNIGVLPEINLIFVFVVALFFGWVVRKTGSLVGVALSRGISYMALYLVIPLLLG